MRFFLPAAILVALLLYGHGLEAPYYLDDPNVINTGSTIPRLLSPRSLGYTTFFLSEKSIEFLSGLFHWEVPFYFRFANLLIHVLTATLVVGLVLELSKRYAPALVAGTLFLVHPIVSQPVMYISQRFESLATLFMVASLSTYVRFRSRGNSAWLAVAMASAGAAVLSKETAVVLPVWILVVEVVFFRSAGWDRRYIYLLPAAALLAVPGWWSFRSSAMTLTSVSWDQYFALQGSVLVKYLQLCLYPAEQFLRYGPGAVPASLWRNLADWGLALAVLSVGIVLIRRHRIIGFGIVTFFVMLLPVTFLPLPDLIFEHRIYPAFVGLAVAAGGLFGLRVNKLTTTVVVALLFTYGIRTFNRTTEWNNQTTFYQGHVRAFPADSQSLTDLAGLYYLQGHTNLARETLELARLNEGFLNPYYSKSSRMNIALNMVSFSLALDDVERAESELNRALALDSNAPPVRRMEGVFYAAAGEPERAAQAYRRLVELVPGSITGWAGLRDAYTSLERFEDAEEALSRIRTLEDRPEGSPRRVLRPTGGWRIVATFGMVAGILAVMVALVWWARAAVRHIKESKDP